MIEAVNSVISNAQIQRSNAEQSSSARAAVESSSQGQSAVAEAPVAPYISPFIEVDTKFDTAVIQIRDSDTGDVVRQFPSESALRARQSADRVLNDTGLFQSSDNSDNVSISSDVSGDSETPEINVPSVNVAEAQQASAALNASAQTSEIAQITINVTA